MSVTCILFHLYKRMHCVVSQSVCQFTPRLSAVLICVCQELLPNDRTRAVWNTASVFLLERREYDSWRRGRDREMATYGKLVDFNQGKEEFAAYLERVELFFVANDIPADKKVPIFLHCIGITTYGLLRSLVAPANPKDKDYRAN